MQELLDARVFLVQNRFRLEDGASFNVFERVTETDRETANEEGNYQEETHDIHRPSSPRHL